MATIPVVLDTFLIDKHLKEVLAQLGVFPQDGDTLAFEVGSCAVGSSFPGNYNYLILTENLTALCGAAEVTGTSSNPSPDVNIQATTIMGPLDLICKGATGAPGTPGLAGTKDNVVGDLPHDKPHLIQGTAGGDGGPGGPGARGGNVHIRCSRCVLPPKASAPGGDGGPGGPGGPGGAKLWGGTYAAGHQGPPGPVGPPGTAKVEWGLTLFEVWQLEKKVADEWTKIRKPFADIFKTAA